MLPARIWSPSGRSLLSRFSHRRQCTVHGQLRECHSSRWQSDLPHGQYCVQLRQAPLTEAPSQGCISSVLSIYTPGTAECSSLGKNASTLPVPSGIIHSSGSSDSATATNTFSTTSFAAGASSASASASSSTAPRTQTPTPTAQSNAGTQRAASPMDTRIGVFVMMAFLLGF